MRFRVDGYGDYIITYMNVMAITEIDSPLLNSMRKTDAKKYKKTIVMGTGFMVKYAPL